MLFTTVDPMPPLQVLALVRALQAVDPKAEVRLDDTGRQARIDSRMTVRQAAAALQDLGIPGSVTALARLPAAAGAAIRAAA